MSKFNIDTLSSENGCNGVCFTFRFLCASRNVLTVIEIAFMILPSTAYKSVFTLCWKLINLYFILFKSYWWVVMPCHGYYLIKFLRSSVGNFNFGKFSLKNLDVFFQGQTLFWPYLRNGWSNWCETKTKGISWMLGTICDLDLWPHSWPWPWMCQGQISK